MSPAKPRRRPTAGPPRPPIRLRPAPVLEPPFDDELPADWQVGESHGAEQLALDLRASPATARTARSTAGRRDPADAAGRPSPRQGRAPAETWQAARRFVGVCLEVLNGYRPAGHVRPLTCPAHADCVIEQLGLARERVTALVRRASRLDRPASRSSMPGPARGPAKRREPVRLRTLHVCEPHRNVAEAAAVLHTGDRTWALAVRLERRKGRWLCTAARTV